MVFWLRQPPFLGVRASCRIDWERTGSWRRMSDRQALRIWTHCTITTRAPWRKSTINFSRSLIRRLVMWKSPCRPSARAATKNVNKAVTNFTKCLTAYMAVPLVVTPSICSNCSSPSLILILLPANRLFLNPPTDYRWRQRWNAEKWVSWLKQHNFAIFRYTLTTVGGKVYIWLCCNLTQWCIVDTRKPPSCDKLFPVKSMMSNCGQIRHF